MADEKHEEVVAGFVAPIEWNVPENVVARYATNMVVQHLEHEFLISFFEVKPPIFIGDPESINKKIEEIKSIQANCVAQIIVAHEKMPSFIDALKKNLERQNEDMREEGE